MCGICAIFSPVDRTPDVDIEKMIDCLVHRGPDEHSSKKIPCCLLGHTIG